MSPRPCKRYDPRSFNTVRHSRRAERARRYRQGRVVLLAIFAVCALLILAGLLFLLLFGVHSCKAKKAAQEAANATPADTDTSNQDIRSASSPDIQYTVVNRNSVEIHAGELIVVNKDHAYEGNTESADQAGFTTISSTVCVDNDNNTIYRRVAGVSLRIEVLDALDRMLTKYHTLADDDRVQLYDAFRSYAAQAALSSSTAAAPGYSDHHTGYLVALRSIDSTDSSLSDEQNGYLLDHGYEFGFVQRYPAGHSGSTFVNNYTNAYRYVGIPHATAMVKKGLCLEEYVEYLKENHKSDQPHLQVAGYEIYYVPASDGETTGIPVPADTDRYSYTISGDNIAGFIVTVKLP